MVIPLLANQDLTPILMLVRSVISFIPLFGNQLTPGWIPGLETGQRRKKKIALT